MKLEDLRKSGFNDSYNIPFFNRYKVICSQCEALVINGIPCHEIGCPNIKHENENEYET